MAKIFITLTGTKHYFGNDFLEKGMKIRLEKEPDNDYDKEAIKVTYEGLGKIGYVANSSYTVIGESMSAGRLYDKIGDTAYAKSVLQYLLFAVHSMPASGGIHFLQSESPDYQM